MNRVEALLAKTLSDWQGWSAALSTQPVVVDELLGGRTNHSFLVESGTCQAVIRINAENSHSLGIDRQREAEILSRLQSIGCVPKTLFITDQVLVTEYISGRRWRGDDFKNDQNLEKISDLLIDIQGIRLPENITPRNYFNYCQSYIEQLPISVQNNEREFIHELQLVTEKIDKKFWQPVISHHDLVPENIIQSDQGVFLLDWEYAAYGHPAIDFARVFGASYKSLSINVESADILLLQQGMDRLWQLLQRQ